MNKAIIAGLAAGVLVVGLIMSPLFVGTSMFTPQAQAQGTGMTHHFTLIADEMELQVAPDNPLHPGGIMYKAMTFNGTIPGPVIAVNQGDKVEITLKNEGTQIHSLDFHAGYGPAKALSGNVASGESKTWTFDAVNAGAFFYHCGADGLNGVWEHIASGMYGAVVVHPHNEKPAKEFYVAFGEIYNSADKGPFVGSNGTVGSFDLGKLWSDNADLQLTNGMAHKYVPGIGVASKIPLNPKAEVFKVKPGEQTRWYIVNAGPNDYVAFHFISGMIDVRDGSIMNRYGTQDKNDETWTIPPGSASVIEAMFPEEGIYVGVDHNMSHVLKGGAFAVLATNDAKDGDQPEGTSVMSREDVMNNKAMPSSGGSNNSGGSTQTDVKDSEDFKIEQIGMVGGNPTITVEGTAGNTKPVGTDDIYAYVMVTDNGTWAVASHGVKDSPAQSAAGDLTWHSHGGIMLDSNNCITAINAQGKAVLNDDMVSIENTGATKIDKAMTVKLTIDGSNICVSEVFDSK